MFCYKCGKEFEGKFCAYCGANNAAVVTSPVMDNEKVQYAERTTVTVEKKEKIKVTPYIFLLLHGLIFFSSNYLVEEIALRVYENDIDDFFGFSSEQVLYEYFSFSNVINTLAVILGLLLGFAVTRNLKVIVVALGSKWLGQIVLSLFSSMVRFAYAKSVGFTAEAYSEYCEIENIIIYAVVSTVLACVIYYFLSNGKRKSKKA